MEESLSDDVGKIHKRYKFTLLTPSSYYLSLVISLVIVSLLVTVTVYGYLGGDNIFLRLLFVIPVLLIVQYIDSFFTKNKEYSKSLHMSLFGNGLWLIAAVAGIISVFILSREEVPFVFITEGMFVFASFRIGIFKTVLGLSLRKAWLICFIQPLAIFLSLVPIDMWVSSLFDLQALGYGITFLIIATVWLILTDRAGKPEIKSTHRLIQTYLNSKSTDDSSAVESIMEEESKVSNVSTFQIKFSTNTSEFRWVLPDIHPGPFHPVGGSNIPYLIYKNMDSSAMVMHSVSDHTLNLPSKEQVENYLESLSESTIAQEGKTCTEPVTVQINRAHTVGLLFGKTAILFLSLSPHGMEDLPSNFKSEIEQFSKNRGFERVLIVDCHNAMGGQISKNDSADLLKAAKLNLDTLVTKESFSFELGYSNSTNMNLNARDLALGGIGMVCLRINGKKHFLGWADANNMENGLKEEVVSQFTKNGYDLLEICTSDSHYTTKDVRNRNGYYQFGIVSNSQHITNWFLELAKKAEKNLNSASFEILKNQTTVKVMGSTIYSDFSRALDNSMKITKFFLIGGLAFFLVTIFL